MPNSTKKTEAKLELTLPDGSKLSASGPMAEELIRRMMNPQQPTIWYYPPYPVTVYPTWIGTTATTTTLSIPHDNGY